MFYDYLIIGSGAGGSAACHSLVKAGKKVLLLEKGFELPSDGTTLDYTRVIKQGLFKSREPWLNGSTKRFVPEEYFNLGGKTKWYGAALLRFDKSEFDADSDFQCLGWPIEHDELAPYYNRAEILLGIRPFPVEPDLKALQDKIKRRPAGWYCVPLMLGLNPMILANENEARHFDGFASAQNLKSDAETALLAPIRAYGNFDIITGTPVKRLLGNRLDPLQITGVQTENGQNYAAKTVVLAAGAMHSPRLLQNYLSVSGLANTLPCAPLVGRYFKRHILTALLALSPSVKTDMLRKTSAWLNDDFPHSSIQPLGFSEDVLTALFPSLVPRGLAKQLAKRAYGFFLQTEDGSNIRNHVNATGIDSGNLPTLDYDTARLPASDREHKAMVRHFKRVLLSAGYMSLVKPIPLAGTAHACGTMITGNLPEQSVVDRNGKVHGFKNLYVADGSILPRSSRVNPALTIYAWALRLADYLLEESSRNEQT